MGGIVIDGGKVTASLQTKSCSDALTNAERERLRMLTLHRDSSEPRPGHPDQIRYTLTAGSNTASWFGEEAPKEIAPLFQLLWQIRQRVVASCQD